MTSLCFHVVGTSRNLPSYWHQNGPGTALYEGYIVVESLSLFITHFAKVREKEIQVGMQNAEDIRAPNCSYAFSMSSTISAYCS